MLRLGLLIIALSIIAAGLACSGSGTAGGSSPTEAYKLLYAAVKAKDTEAIKTHLSKKTIEFGAMASARSRTPVERVYENGFTETTFSSSLPAVRDERIKDTMGAVEVWNSQKSTWEDLPFVLEDGAWKLAVGEQFSGSYKSPGQGRDEKEREAANVMAPPKIPEPNSNSNKPPTVLDIPIDPPAKSSK